MVLCTTATYRYIARKQLQRKATKVPLTYGRKDLSLGRIPLLRSGVCSMVRRLFMHRTMYATTRTL